MQLHLNTRHHCGTIDLEILEELLKMKMKIMKSEEVDRKM
jgi:hypothetical protein